MSTFPPTVDHWAIQQAFWDVGVYSLRILDSNYALPARQWLEKFGRALEEFSQLELTTIDYYPDGNDCDDFAEDARYLARKLHRRTRQDQSAIAFGVVTYVTRAGGGHAINVAMCREGGLLVPVWWEPQTQREVELTDDERRTACVTI